MEDQVIALHFQEGFSGDDVSVTANGRVVGTYTGITTQQTLGLAAEEQFQIPEYKTEFSGSIHKVEVVISVKSRSMEGGITFDPATDGTNLAVSITDDRVICTVSQKPFYYA